MGPDSSVGTATSTSGRRVDSDRMARGGGLNLVGAIIQQSALLAIVTMLAHVLGKDDVGRYAECFALLSLLGLMALAGFRSGLTRFVAIHLADADVPRLRGTIRLGMGITAGGSCALAAALALLAPTVAHVMGDEQLVAGVRLVALTLPAHALSEAALAATQGWRTQKAYTVVGRIFDPVLRLALTAAALWLGYGYLGAMWSLAIASWVTAVLALAALWLRLKDVPHQHVVYRIGDVMSFSMVSWASALAATGLIWADTLILGAMTDAGQVGVYNIATRLVTLAVFVLPPITAAFGPHMAHLHHSGDQVGAARAYGSATRWTLLLSMPAFVVLLVFPQQMLKVFGGGFTEGAVVTMVLACGQLVGAAAGPCGVVLNMSGRVALSLLDNALVLVANIGLNLLLIPRWGIVGAAVAWSASIIAVNAVKVVQARRIVGIRAEGASTGKILLAALPAAGAGVLVNHLVDGWVASLVVGAAACGLVYLAGIVLLGPHPEDVRVWRRLTTRLGRLSRRAA
ncbi:flippase [Terrabacter lapilli]|uniref:Flippase n=1 Tax=Terrabacter lapilli TaxID=436231 RepID=A0ABN2R781_9MICO